MNNGNRKKITLVFAGELFRIYFVDEFSPTLLGLA
jgi:hypothetical protein